MTVRDRRLFAATAGITCLTLSLVCLLPNSSVPKISRSHKSQHIDYEVFNRYRKVTAERWIVVTTVSYPTPEMRLLAEIPGWKLVVVGDTKTPKNWSLANCIYLSVHDQRGFGFDTESLLPSHSYTRKTVGYLFAISHGAKVIYETDDDNRPIDQLENFVLDKTMWGLSTEDKGLFNPYRHFGQLTLRPRGYPLSAIEGNFTSDYRLDHYKTPSIQQGLDNGEPDVDAIFRLTRKQTNSVLNVTFDGKAPPVVVPARVFSPFNSRNTLFLYDAFWALLIPTTVTHHVCDIIRGYWAQRLLWEIGGNIGFFPSNVFIKGRSHSYMSDTKDEKDVYFKAESVITFLNEWKCKPGKSFFDCMIQLSTDMVHQNFWKDRDKLMTESWVRDLTAIAYREPQRIPFGSLKQGVKIIERKLLPKQMRLSSQASFVKFWAVQQTPPLKHSSSASSLMISHIVQIASYCNNTPIKISQLSPAISLKSFPNILLIVVFNFPFYYNVPFLEAMYKMHFPRIVYCGSDKKQFARHLEHTKPVSFIELDIHRGWFAHICLTQAMKMNYKVDGYLFIGDDVLLNVWNLHTQPWDKLWFIDGKILLPSVGSHWNWIKSPHVGWKTYQSARNASKSLDQDRFKKFFSRLANNTGDKDGLIRGASDIAYVPKRYQQDVLYFLEHFSKFNLFLEIAIPSVFGGVELWENVHKLSGDYLWYDGKRKHYEKHFNSSKMFLHPVKISQEMQTTKGQEFYCKTFFPFTLQSGK